MNANERFGAPSGSTIDTVDARAALKTDCPEVPSRPREAFYRAAQLSSPARCLLPEPTPEDPRFLRSSMPITSVDIAVLTVICRYYVLTREQIQKLCFPGHNSGRSTRKRLSKLCHAGYVVKHRIPVVPTGQMNAAPVYYPTAKAAELIASHFDDERWLATNTRTPRSDLLSHWVAIADTHVTVEQAIAIQADVKLCGWFNEWETVNKTAGDKDRFYLHTQLNQAPPLSCSPDAAFMLALRGHRKVFYIEQDRNTSGVRQIASAKTPGYAELAARQGHRKHFPETTLPAFSVLFITTHPHRRDAAAKAISKMKGADLWLFISQTDLKPEAFLFEPITYNCKGEAGPLVNPPVDGIVPPTSDQSGHLPVMNACPAHPQLPASD